MPEPAPSHLVHASRAELEALAACGEELVRCEAQLRAADLTPVTAALAGAAEAAAWQHYPDGDVYDPASHAQYFYHIHAPGEGGGDAHGHFHTFLRARGLPLDARPLVMPELAIAGNPAAPHGPPVPSAPRAKIGEAGDPWTHLVAVSLDAAGRPVALFTTNRWVTDETWYAAADAAAALKRFALTAAAPAPLLNQWITALIGFFRLEIAALLQERDAVVMDWRRRRRGKVHVLEDRRLEVTSRRLIDIEAQHTLVDAALRQVA
jgi:hypothetical protein